jgi:Tfp pilus assembly protein PilX
MKAEWGFALVFSLMILLMVTLLALGAINTSVLDIKIGSNDLTSKKAFYVEAPCRVGSDQVMGVNGTGWRTPGSPQVQSGRPGSSPSV